MNQEIIYFLNILEGYKTRCKNLHWAATDINTHEYLDKFLEELSEFQDAIAEGYLGIYRGIDTDVIVGAYLVDIDTAYDLVVTLLSEVFTFYGKIPSVPIYKGILSEVEAFIQTINKYRYLFNLCHGK